MKRDCHTTTTSATRWPETRADLSTLWHGVRTTADATCATATTQNVAQKTDHLWLPRCNCLALYHYRDHCRCYKWMCVTGNNWRDTDCNDTCPGDDCPNCRPDNCSDSGTHVSAHKSTCAIRITGDTRYAPSWRSAQRFYRRIWATQQSQHPTTIPFHHGKQY